MHGNGGARCVGAALSRIVCVCVCSQVGCSLSHRNGRAYVTLLRAPALGSLQSHYILDGGHQWLAMQYYYYFFFTYNIFLQFVKNGTPNKILTCTAAK